MCYNFQRCSSYMQTFPILTFFYKKKFNLLLIVVSLETLYMCVCVCVCVCVFIYLFIYFYAIYH